VVIGGSVVGYRSATAYAGPGDIVSGAAAWWGLRAYSIASIGGNAIRLRRDSDNGEQDFATVTGGGLDLSAIASFKGAANLFVAKLYDQTGQGNDLLQATAANQPGFVLSGLGSLPIMTFDGSASRMQAAGIINGTSHYPFTITSFISRTSGAATQSTILYGPTGSDQMRFETTADTASYYAGTLQSGTCSDDDYHSLIGVFDGASSNLYADAASISSANPGVTTFNGNPALGDAPGFSVFFLGKIQEVGFWGSALTGTNVSNISTNQHSYWGI
jgi:Concanavalin A-like lectin/glucanases superfamily